MGILDTLKTAAVDILKTVAEEALKNAVGAESNTQAPSAKAETLVGSQAITSPVLKTLSSNVVVSVNAAVAAARSAAALAGSQTTTITRTPTAVSSANMAASINAATVAAKAAAALAGAKTPIPTPVSSANVALSVSIATAAAKAAAALAGTKTPTPTPVSSANMALSISVAAAAVKTAAALTGSNVVPKELSHAEVVAIIEARVRAKGNPSNWQVSIVDLMTALDMNSSLAARKVLADKLKYSGHAADGSAEKNLWLHAELLKVLAKNEGRVPSYLF